MLSRIPSQRVFAPGMNGAFDARVPAAPRMSQAMAVDPAAPVQFNYPYWTYPADVIGPTVVTTEPTVGMGTIMTVIVVAGAAAALIALAKS